MKKVIMLLITLCVCATYTHPATIATAMRACSAECADNYMDGSREKEECEEQCEWDEARTKTAMRSNSKQLRTRN